MTKKIAVPVHVAVLSAEEGTLRLVKSDGEGGLIEVGVLAVGPDAGRKRLADVVSAAQMLAEMSGTLGGGSPRSVPEPGGEVSPPPETPRPATPKALPAAGKAPVKRRYRSRRANESRFTEDDILRVIGAAMKRGAPGLRPVEIATTICEELGEEYHGKNPLARAIGNKLRPMQRGGLLVRRDFDGLYTLPEAAGDIPVETVENSDVSERGLVGAVANGTGARPTNESWLELREG